MKNRPLIIALLLNLLYSSAFAAQTDCPRHYWDGQPPKFINGQLAVNTQEICYEGYGDIYSAVTLTPLAVGERLTKQNLRSHRSERQNGCHADLILPEEIRSEPVDYEKSGFDKGCMVPSSDMATENAQNESFSLANVIPQNPGSRKLWEGIEAATRELAKRDGHVYVVSGPIFYGSNFQRIGGRVLVPTHIYKAIYDPSLNKAAAYLVKNEPGMEYAVISISELTRVSGMDPFPGLPENIKQKAMKLPTPVAHGRKPGVEDPSIIPH